MGLSASPPVTVPFGESRWVDPIVAKVCRVEVVLNKGIYLKSECSWGGEYSVPVIVLVGTFRRTFSSASPWMKGPPGARAGSSLNLSVSWWIRRLMTYSVNY
jgi:hypothetical protein